MKVILTVLLLALASLGSALPPQRPALPPQRPASPPSLSSIETSVLAHPDSVQAITDEVKVSPDCAAAIFDIVTDPKVLKCLPMDAVLPVLKIVTDPDLLKKFKSDPAGTFKQIEQPLVTFSDGFCPVQECGADVLGDIVQKLGKSCAEDLKTNPVVQMMFAFFVFYPPIHDSICFKSSSTKKYCWDETLTTVVSLPKSPFKVTGDPFVDAIAVSDCKAVCTDCDKDFVNTVFNYIADPKNPLHDTIVQLLQGAGLTQDKLDQLKVAIAVKCGAGFEDGKIPDKPKN